MIRRGEVWWAAFGTPTGSEPAYRRPAVVLQSNDFNQSGLRTVVIVAISSNLTLAQAPGNVLCRKGAAGLPKPSVINVSQIATVDKGALLERIGALPHRVQLAVEQGVRLVLEL